MAVSNGLLRISSLPAVPSQESSSTYRDLSAFLSGSSPAITQLLSQIRRVAPYFRTALLTGERGCGEEAAACALHQSSPLAARPFLKLTPVDAEFKLANGYDAVVSYGMLYLSQPERIPPAAQRTLLRLLRERGPNAPRLVAFAERGLRSLVSMGAFSAELADSLDALRITLPPLRERREDIPALLTQMLQDQAGRLASPPPMLTPGLLDLASKQAWQGNFEQLRITAIGLLERGAGVTLHAADLEAVLNAAPEPVQRDRREVRMVSLDLIMHEHIRSVLFACNGNKLRAAEVLGISRSTLYRMLDSKLPEERAAHAEAEAEAQAEAEAEAEADQDFIPELRSLRIAG